ncbi:metal ABC transporter solute-binding protein, Zn/Mn family [Chamaesiphon minutus]|uniref:ABC-type metal ion transport system, periplasmic component/surface adhesin n=1 Tax=Chamaesiphon minutus (strain ATCC 27169 / PCC 6605) TaxID=1173020 RepID=K9UBN9_CHAP6|nr:zinc ABC transporter substrate-binding protein [Chamaesiphon minutus]AFY92245.1 ABC-type metal ion transport system, periplasmic component/surface adhesin [Chamaesiphon minutus PCC 6605]
MTIANINPRRSNSKQPLRHNWLVSSILAIGLITGCTSPNKQPTDAASPTASETPTTTTAANTDSSPKVVVTNTVLCDLTKQIAASTVNVVCLLAAGSDPHVYKLTPEARQSIEKAQLVLYGGYDFEPELIKAIKATSNPAPKIAVHEVAVPKPQQFEEHGKSTADPHVWHNAQHGSKMAETIAANLEKLVPAQAATYKQNTQKLTSEIGQLDTWIKSQINTIPAAKKVLFTTHDALGYYSTAYGIPVDALEGLSTEEKPNAARAKEMVGKIKKVQVPTIFAELTLNPKLLTAIAKEANVKVAKQELYVDGLGEAGSLGETYQKMLVSNTKTIVEGLGGKYTPFPVK